MERKKLLIALFPYIDESKLLHNTLSESGIQKLWEDEFLPFSFKNDLSLNETCLVTPMKDTSFKKELTQF